MGSLCSLGASVYYNTRFDIRFPQAAATFTFSPHFALKKFLCGHFIWGGKCVAEMKFVGHLYQILAVLADPSQLQGKTLHYFF